MFHPVYVAKDTRENVISSEGMRGRVTTLTSHLFYSHGRDEDGREKIIWADGQQKQATPAALLGSQRMGQKARA